MPFQNLFGTPIWTFNFYAPQLNQKLKDASTKLSEGEYFSNPGSGIFDLKRRVLDHAGECLKEFNLPFDNLTITGRQNTIQPNGVDTPHSHPLSFMVGVYYVQVPPNSGDILLHDPRGSVLWPEPEAVTETDKQTRAYHRITPIEGQLLLFPGYLVHSVEPNFSKDARISIAMSING